MPYNISKHSQLRRIEVAITQGTEITAKMLLKGSGSEIEFGFDLTPADILKLKQIIEAHTYECPHDGSRCMTDEENPT